MLSTFNENAKNVYFQGGSSSQNLDIDESKKECGGDMDICFGYLTMISANFTKQSSTTTEIVPIYEVRIEKGCGRKNDFMKNVQLGK